MQQCIECIDPKPFIDNKKYGEKKQRERDLETFSVYAKFTTIDIYVWLLDSMKYKWQKGGYEHDLVIVRNVLFLKEKSREELCLLREADWRKGGRESDWNWKETAWLEIRQDCNVAVLFR